MYDPAGWCRGRCARHGCADGGAAEKNNQKQQAQVHRGNGWRHWYLHVYKLYTALRSLYVVHRIAAVYIEFREPINLFSCELMIGRWWVLDILRLAWHICLVDLCFLVRRKAAYVELSRGIAGRNRGSCALRWTQCSVHGASSFLFSEDDPLEIYWEDRRRVERAAQESSPMVRLTDGPG
jgi:hypothetical protein